ncbi:MAG: hypothetical protein IJ351_06885 [Oscillospiraceae bacterium]|nr:hypothetical protein [Oscillospiraceae bacterium]
MKKLFSLLLCLMLIFSLTISASAATDATVTYNGKSKGFSFAPGSSYSDTDLFPNFKNVMPGDVRTQEITVKNRASSLYKVKIYMRAKGAHAGDEKFLEQLKLTVQKGSGILFQAPADETAQLTDWTLLGTFYTGGTATLDVTLDVPITLGNDAQEAIGKLDWEFAAEEIPLDVTNPKTGDMIFVAGIVLAVSGAALVLILLFKRRKSGK